METNLIISMIATIGLSVLSAYLIKDMKKLRFIRDLAVCLINALDDHEISEEEVEDIKEKIDNLT